MIYIFVILLFCNTSHIMCWPQALDLAG